ncbi:unnamed protein product [Closterium sp. Naga37s-1]|nr:unnamed protein product [Closterium sp. Naga37s-1]
MSPRPHVPKPPCPHDPMSPRPHVPKPPCPHDPMSPRPHVPTPPCPHAPMSPRSHVPCVALVENMVYFEAEGKRYFPFSKGSASKVGATVWHPTPLRTAHPPRGALRYPTVHHGVAWYPTVHHGVACYPTVHHGVACPHAPHSRAQPHPFHAPPMFYFQLSAAGDSGQPEVVEDPLGEVARTFTDVGACVVQQCAKLRQQGECTPWLLLKYQSRCGAG